MGEASFKGLPFEGSSLAHPNTLLFVCLFLKQRCDHFHFLNLYFHSASCIVSCHFKSKLSP